MSVYAFVELVGTSDQSWERAACAAIESAARSLRDMRVAQVDRLDMVAGPDGELVYRARLKVSFKYDAAGLPGVDDGLRGSRGGPLPGRLAGRSGAGGSGTAVPAAVADPDRRLGARPRPGPGHHRRQPHLVLRLGGADHGGAAAAELRRQGRVPGQLADPPSPARTGDDPREPHIRSPGPRRAADGCGRAGAVGAVRHLSRGHPVPRRRPGPRPHGCGPHRRGQRGTDHPGRHRRHGGHPAPWGTRPPTVQGGGDPLRTADRSQRDTAGAGGPAAG